MLTSLTVTPSSTVAKKFSLPTIGTLKKTQQKNMKAELKTCCMKHHTPNLTFNQGYSIIPLKMEQNVAHEAVLLPHCKVISWPLIVVDHMQQAVKMEGYIVL